MTYCQAKIQIYNTTLARNVPCRRTFAGSASAELLQASARAS
jgi:hypothetical protein